MSDTIFQRDPIVSFFKHVFYPLLGKISSRGGFVIKVGLFFPRLQSEKSQKNGVAFCDYGHLDPSAAEHGAKNMSKKVSHKRSDKFETKREGMGREGKALPLRTGGPGSSLYLSRQNHCGGFV